MESERKKFVILPEEMWEHIFSKMVTPNGVHIGVNESKPIRDIATSDLLNCSRVCEDFARILKITETTWIFKEVRALLPFNASK